MQPYIRYVLAQIKLFDKMCTGRSYNVISWLEKSFPYSLLLNMASNERLPHEFRAAVIELIGSLYIDRFPQVANCGSPSLPEQLFIFEDDLSKEKSSKSLTPILKQLKINDDSAFPAFSISPHSSIASDPDPILSHPDHFKFFLMRTLCNRIVSSMNSSGTGVTHSQVALNNLVGAAIRCQHKLLDFGFQSTYIKLEDLVSANVTLLDGRCELKSPNQSFYPASSRYHQVAGLSEVATTMKRGVISIFSDVQNLSLNYRLSKLLFKFKQHCSSKSIIALTDKQLIFEDAVSLFSQNETKEDTALLEFARLSGKPDFDELLLDSLMYEDDLLMAASLDFLSSKFNQLRSLEDALATVTLLQNPSLPFYGSVNQLRVELGELNFLQATATRWGVKSLIAVSRPFVCSFLILHNLIVCVCMLCCVCVLWN